MLIWEDRMPLKAFYLVPGGCDFSSSLSDDGRLLHCRAWPSLFSKQRSGEIHLTQQWAEFYEEASSGRFEHAELQIRIQLFPAVHLFEQGTTIGLAFSCFGYRTIRL